MSLKFKNTIWLFVVSFMMLRYLLQVKSKKTTRVNPPMIEEKDYNSVVDGQNRILLLQYLESKQILISLDILQQSKNELLEIRVAEKNKLLNEMPAILQYIKSSD